MTSSQQNFNIITTKQTDGKENILAEILSITY